MGELPRFAERIERLETVVAEGEATLPPRRDFSDLTPTQIERITELTGLSRDDLEAGMTGSDKDG